MPLPANTTTVVVLGTFLTPEGNPSTGTITFTPSAWLLNSGANVAIPNSGVTKTLGTAGQFSVTLPVTDDVDLSPNPFIYSVSEVIDGVSQSYNISIPGTVASGGTVYLADLAPVAAAGPEYYSLASSLSIGTVSTLAAGSAATATITGLAPSQILNLGLPTGPAGSAATVTVGTVGSVAYPGPGTVTNSGSSSAAVLDFTLVTGQTGATGATGPQGAAGSAATVTVGTVGAVAYPGPGTVTNSGNTSAAVLDFILVTGQQGATGPQGATGSAATIAVGTVTSVPYGGTASVTNVGNSAAGTFDFVLVTGPQGDLAGLTANDPIDYTSNTFSLMYGAGLGTASGGTLVADFFDGTPAALSAAGAAGTSIELARGDHVHARPTPADIGAVGTATAINSGTALAGGGDLSTSRTLNVVLSDATPAAVGTPAAGTAVTPSRADHVHEGTTLSSATPAALGTATAGTATTASRGDHVHAMPSASDVGAVANSLFANKGTIAAASAASTPAALSVGSNGQMLMADSSATAGLRYVDPPASRNLIINGAMQVAQRGTTASGITTAGYYTADRWSTIVDNQGTWTQSVDADAPTGSGVRNSLKMLCTTADASPAAADRVVIRQRLEGQDLQRVKKGTSGAEQLTLSFWVKSNVTGTFAAALIDDDNNREVDAVYTVTSSATWEKKTITFPADTTGILDNDNNQSLQMQFWLGAGTDWTSGTRQTSWGAAVNSGRAVGQTNLAAATNNYWQVTGVQLETGPVATPFEFEPYEATLRKCQRYYYLHASGASKQLSIGAYNNTNVVAGAITFPTSMRTAPTLIASSGTDYYRSGNGGSADDFNSLTIQLAHENGSGFFNNSEAAGGSQYAATNLWTLNASASVAFNAEL